MSSQDKVSTPQSSTGILRFSDVDTGGPKLDPRGVVIFTIALILIIKIVSMVMAKVPKA
ncbi:MAG: preprotein translocase subunit Sec61beta [Candidatus Micrarchaeota archaeon]